MSMETYQCPADGCEYSGAKASVLGHYSGKRDDEHTGGYREARQILNDEEPTGEVSVDDDPTDTAESSEDASDSDPVMGSGETSFEQSTEVELPCGHESYDEEEAPAMPFNVRCDVCGTVFTVRES